MRFARITLVSLCCVLAMVCACGCGKRAVQTVTLQADTTAAAWPKSSTEQATLMKQCGEVIKKRLASQEPNQDCRVKLDGTDKIVIEFPAGVDAVAESNGVLQDAGKTTLEFYHLKNVRSRNNPLGEWQIQNDQNGPETYIFTSAGGQRIDSSKQPAEVLSKVVNAKANPPVLSGKDLLPNARADINQGQQVSVNIEFSEQGTKTFGQFTRENVDEYLAVFYNGKLLTAPTIREPITNGRAEITGFKTLEEARKAASAINSGPLPIAFKVVKK